MIWIAMAVLALTASGIVAASAWKPALVQGPAEDRTLAVLKDQLSEVDRDAERGLLSVAEAHAARQEIKRRVLSVGRVKNTGESNGGGRVILMAAAVFVPLFAAGYYSFAGAPNLSSIAFEDRQAEVAQNREIEALAQKLLQRLQADSEGGALEGWMLLGQTFMKLGRASDAASAYERATQSMNADSAVFSIYAEALIVSEQGIVTPQAKRAIARALELDPTNPAGTFYDAVGLAQAGANEQAYNRLLTRLDEVDGFAPWMETFVAEANRIGAALGRAPISLSDYAPVMSGNSPGPTAADVEAASQMDDVDRDAFIRSMVERLATRLEAEPDDIDGWMRLGRAYRVLGETDLALNAYSRAKELLVPVSSEDPRQSVILQSLEELQSGH